MLQKTEGIVIHTIQYSDNSVIAKIFTADYGFVPFMVKGIRGKKSNNKAMLFQPLNILALDIYYRENKNLQLIKEAKIIFNPVSIYGNIQKTSVVLFLAEVLQKILKENYSNVSLFGLLKQKISDLNDQPFHADFHLNVLIDITNELGFLPFDNYSDNECIFSIQEGKFVNDSADHTGDYYMSKTDSRHFHLLLSAENMNMVRNERRSLLNEILKYFQFHNPGMNKVKSVAVLQEIF